MKKGEAMANYSRRRSKIERRSNIWAGFVSIASMGPGDLNTRPMDSMSPKPARF
jgi:hypothetical protein